MLPELRRAFPSLTLQQQLFVEPFLLAVAKRHAIARHKSVTLDDLHGEQLLLLKYGHCMRDQALADCSSAGAAEHATFRATSLETLRQMVAVNAGVGLWRLRCHAREEIDAVDSGLVRTLHCHAAVSTVC